MVAQGVAVLLAYGAVAQAVPAPWVPVGAALGLAMLAEGARKLAVGRMAPALGVALALVVLWAAWPLGIWLGRVLLSLVGEPVLVRDLPGISEVARRIALPAMALGLALWGGVGVGWGGEGVGEAGGLGNGAGPWRGRGACGALGGLAPWDRAVVGVAFAGG